MSFQEGAIVQVAFSPDDNILAYATRWAQQRNIYIATKATSKSFKLYIWHNHMVYK